MLVFVSRKDISAQHTENVNSKLGLMVLRDMQWAEGRGSAVGRGQGKCSGQRAGEVQWAEGRGRVGSCCNGGG